MLAFLFWLALLGLIYLYIGYPLAVLLLGRVRCRPVHKDSRLPVLTVLIAAYNEADHIETTVRNKLEQDYPADKLEVLVVSDGSDDGTDDIVASIDDPRVRLLRQEPRAGKTSGLNMAVPHVQGEILVFSDANSIYAPSALQKLAANFADDSVGYVTGKMVYANPDGSPVGEGCSAYMRYENFLREQETRIGSVVGVDGGIDAVRTRLYQPMNPDQLPDFVLPLRVVEQGYRVVYEPEAVLWESALGKDSEEYRMRVRVSLRAIWALFDMRQLLSGRIDRLFAWQLWSHKVLRYLAFIFLLCAYLTNWGLWGAGAIYKITLILQHVFYLVALLQPRFQRQGRSMRLLTFARYFSLLNLASAHAFFKFLQGKKQVLWTPRKG